MAGRALKLNKQLDAVIGGKQVVTRVNAAQFLEAIYSQPEPVACIHKVITSKAGLDSIQKAVFTDFSSPFLNNSAARFVLYLRAPELKDIGGGHYVEQIVNKLVQPPVFWHALSQAFTGGQLQADGQLAFAWLLLNLVSLPAEQAAPYRELAGEDGLVTSILESPNPDTRAIGHKLKHVLETVGGGSAVDPDNGPGGRHDNDHADFRNISILPTTDETMSKEPAFIRTAADVDQAPADQRFATHLDNQFRLYREDMLYEIRDELQIISGQRKGFHRGLVLDGLTLLDMYGVTGSLRGNMYDKWGVILQMKKDEDLWFFKRDKPKDRESYLDNDRKLIKDGSMAALIVNGVVLAFANIRRDISLLAKKPPRFVLQLEGKQATIDALCKCRGAQDIKLVQIDTAVFSYEPVLKALQQITAMPLAPELVNWEPGAVLEPPPHSPTAVIESLRRDPRQDLKSLIGTPKSIVLDPAQSSSLLSGLTERVSIIQGPPGTGKSFVGALIAKVLHDHTKQKILVCCYTNHALDQFLEDLLDIGIPESSLVRLGGKSTTRTEPLSLYRQKRATNFGRPDWAQVRELETNASSAHDRLRTAFDAHLKAAPSLADLMDHVEFDAPEFFRAFQVPPSALNGDMRRVGKRGRAVDRIYLINQWVRGWDAGMFKNAPNVREAAAVWGMPGAERQKHVGQWREALLREGVEHLYDLGKVFNDYQEKLSRKHAEHEERTLLSKRIIGCTTTAAAKYSEHLRSALPEVVLVEEAGEILESHVLTALGEETRRLILIGDHKQLRPKVNNYALSVEKEEGYDLNRSLFERLVLRGYPHQTLTKQHRMRPEISSYIRQLTYPDLVDAPGTLNRPNLRGVRDNIVFITHAHPEDEHDRLRDVRETTKASKQNTYEVEMVLKILRYLAQNGYGTDKVVILTPYLGQLHRLQQALQKGAEMDPVLNDLDSFDLVRAGLLPAGAAKVPKKRVRLATIDNYQGEESEIVIASLTRSNPSCDIGFMYSPERLNVLLSRARDALIMIGNAETFSGSRRGKDLWTSLFKMLRNDGHMYDGLPAKCERHPDRHQLLKQPDDFLEHCPEGGCTEPCGAVLSCQVHTCPSKCHQLYDHSKMKCDFILDYTCPNGHRRSYRCHQGPPLTCKKCEEAAKRADDKQRKEFEKQVKRDEEQKAHLARIAKLDEEIEAELEAQRERERARQRDNAILQKQRDLADAKARSAKQAASPPAPALAPSNPQPVPSRSAPTPPQSPSSTDQPPSLPPSPHAPAPDGPAQPSLGLLQRVLNIWPPSPLADEATKPAPSTDDDAPQPLPPSPSETEWQRQKDMDGADNASIDAIMAMTGLEDVKAQVLKIKAKIDVSQRQGTSVSDERFNVVLQGNPGTGKTTIARHYAKFLASVDVLPGTEFLETTGSRLANDGVSEIKKKIEKILEAGGGAIFIDEAYQLTGAQNFGGGQVLDFLLAEMENNVGKLVFILAGYNKQMEKFFEHNPGLTSRVPYALQFRDYTDAELLHMLHKLVTKKYAGRMKIEGGMHGLYMRIAVRRLGRGRGKDGFGNARALQNMFTTISERQATRLTSERKTGRIPDDFVLAKEDIIGPDPSQAVLKSDAWQKLQALTGLTEVKKSIQNLFDLIAVNYKRELKEKDPIQMSFNRVFLGNPGTGKTTVAKLYGQVLADLGLLSNGEVVIKNPADFVGSVLGQSEENTKAILATTVGKVLVIDEAYSLYGGASTGGKQSDPYKTAVIDTIVAEIQSVPGEDRCVLMCGYEPQMREMFQNVNPGLSRRFAIDDAFRFEDFTDAELLDILNLKLKQQHLDASASAKAVAIDLLSRARNRPNFGNGGEVENMLGKAKGNYQARQARLPVAQRPYDVVFEPVDFDPDFSRADNSETNLKKLFEDVVGCEKVVAKLQEYQNIARVMKARGKEARDARELIPTNFIFKGPPGTGKTTTARKMGKVYYDMGFLSSDEVVECSASDLVGEYVGQTGPKTKQVFERALGKVLFVDEAYRLAEGPFAKEAMDELVGILTQDAFIGKLIVILAGYDQEMNQLLAVNTGLSSRFPEEIYFENMAPAHCLKILAKKLAKEDIACPEVTDAASEHYRTMLALLQQLSALPSWGNARDMGTLAKQMVRTAFKTVASVAPGDALTLSGADAVACIQAMLDERLARVRNLPPTQRFSGAPPPLPVQTREPPLATPPATSTATAHATDTAPPPEALEERTAEPAAASGRDPGVSDAVWAQLQSDKKAALDLTRRREEELRALEQAAEEARQAAERAKALEADMARRAREAAADAELKRKFEEQRLKRLAAEAEAERRRRAAEEQRRKEMEERRREAKAQEKLRHMGVCVAGYRWIKQGGGYRCGGGSHFVSDAQLEM